MSLRDFIARVHLACETATSIEALARSVRDALPVHLVDPVFRLDCVERILQRGLLDPDPDWDHPPIHFDRRHCYSLRVFFWLPGYFAPPHQHNTWGATGVLLNEASVRMYRRDEEARRLVLEREFAARAGEAGYLLPPCTHSVGNAGGAVCATFHVFSVSPDPAQRRNDTLWHPAPAGEPAPEPRRAALLGTAEILKNIKGPRARALRSRLPTLAHDHALL